MFTIGEFSRLSCISARMLRHYDSIGLIHPKTIGDDNGYRYYDISQLQKVRTIEKLKKYEFTLNEIKELLKLSQEELMDKLKVQYKSIQKQKEYYENLMKDMEAEIDRKEDFSMNNYHVITMNMKEQKVLAVKATINICEESMHNLAETLKTKLKESKLKQIGPMQISYLDEEFNPENAQVEMQIEVNGDGQGVKVVPEGLYVTVMHQGSMKEIHKAYEAIMTWLSINDKYEISGPSIERLVVHEGMVKDDSELETAVMFPVKSK